MLFYDSVTGSIFKSSVDEINDAVSKLNRNLYDKMHYQNSGRFLSKSDILISEELLTKELLDETFDYSNLNNYGVSIDNGCMPQLEVEFYAINMNGDPAIVPKYTLEIFG